MISVELGERQATKGKHHHLASGSVVHNPAEKQRQSTVFDQKRHIPVATRLVVKTTRGRRSLPILCGSIFPKKDTKPPFCSRTALLIKPSLLIFCLRKNVHHLHTVGTQSFCPGAKRSSSFYWCFLCSEQEPSATTHGNSLTLGSMH